MARLSSGPRTSSSKKRYASGSRKTNAARATNVVLRMARPSFVLPTRWARVAFRQPVPMAIPMNALVHANICGKSGGVKTGPLVFVATSAPRAGSVAGKRQIAVTSCSMGARGRKGHTLTSMATVDHLGCGKMGATLEPSAHRLVGTPGGRRCRAHQKTIGIIRWHRCHRCTDGGTLRIIQRCCLGRSMVRRLAVGRLLMVGLTPAHTQDLDMRYTYCLCCCCCC
mmetsp:Transcript_69401/g.137217  ORF Transcript_69401/g.137217 Transcript_69401/m.137217 type:complete len:225 (+) Transcript_69401:386-1060(+)